MPETLKSTANAAQIKHWNAVAGKTWAQFHELLDRQIEALGLAAIDARPSHAGRAARGQDNCPHRCGTNVCCGRSPELRMSQFVIRHSLAVVVDRPQKRPEDERKPAAALRHERTRSLANLCSDREPESRSWRSAQPSRRRRRRLSSTGERAFRCVRAQLSGRTFALPQLPSSSSRECRSATASLNTGCEVPTSPTSAWCARVN
jgi:hypothetical protein